MTMIRRVTAHPIVGGGYRGSMTIREALTRSINTIAFQTFKKMGSETALSYLDKMKF